MKDLLKYALKSILSIALLLTFIPVSSVIVNADTLTWAEIRDEFKGVYVYTDDRNAIWYKVDENMFEDTAGYTSAISDTATVTVNGNIYVLEADDSSLTFEKNDNVTTIVLNNKTLTKVDENNVPVSTTLSSILEGTYMNNTIGVGKIVEENSNMVFKVADSNFTFSKRVIKVDNKYHVYLFNSDYPLVITTENGKASKLTMYGYDFIPLHSHTWAYAADGATLYAYCTSEEGCDYQGSATDLSKAITLTLTKARTDTNFTGLPNTALFDYDEADAWEAATGKSAPTITYEAKSGSKLTEVEGEMCAVKIGSYTAKATIGSATAALDFEITRKEHSEAVDKVIDFDETDWEYRFYLDGTYTSDVTGDTVGDVSSLRFYNCSDDVVSYVGAPLGSTLIGGHSMKVTTATISMLTAGTQNAAGIECEYDATTHILKITPISAAVIHKDTNDFEVTSDSVSKTFTQGQTSTSTIHIAGISRDSLKADAADADYKGVLVMNGNNTLTQGTDYTVEEGSVKINLTKAYLDTLSVGTHNIKVYVKHNDVATATDNDYEFDATVIINAKSNPTPQPEPTPETPSRPIYKAPNTGVR